MTKTKKLEIGNLYYAIINSDDFKYKYIFIHVVGMSFECSKKGNVIVYIKVGNSLPKNEKEYQKLKYVIMRKEKYTSSVTNLIMRDQVDNAKKVIRKFSNIEDNSLSMYQTIIYDSSKKKFVEKFNFLFKIENTEHPADEYLPFKNFILYPSVSASFFFENVIYLYNGFEQGEWIKNEYGNK